MATGRLPAAFECCLFGFPSWENQVDGLAINRNTVLRFPKRTTERTTLRKAADRLFGRTDLEAAAFSGDGFHQCFKLKKFHLAGREKLGFFSFYWPCRIKTDIISNKQFTDVRFFFPEKHSTVSLCCRFVAKQGDRMTFERKPLRNLPFEADF